MGLAFAIVIAIGTLLAAVITVFGNMMSDAPTVQGPSPWPILIVGLSISAALAFTHFHHVGW